MHEEGIGWKHEFVGAPILSFCFGSVDSVIVLGNLSVISDFA